MTTSRSTVEFICEALEGARPVSTRAMFGEYALYCDSKVVGLICDDTLYLKDTPGARALVQNPNMGSPYPKAKPHFVISAELDDPDALRMLVWAICDDLPEPKPKKPRKKKT